MSVKGTRSLSQFGASFRPTPPKLSPPQLDLSTPPPAQLFHDAQDPSTRRQGPLVELVVESPVIAKSLSNQRSAAKTKCYVVAADQDDSAISDTEETPREVVLQGNLKRERSKQPRRRPVQATSEPLVACPAPRVQWNATVHCHAKPFGRCVLMQVEYSTQCAVHACQAVLEDGRQCGNYVPKPRQSRFCKQGYHKETGTLDLLEDMYAARQRQNDIDRENRMAELREGRDWVDANHPELKDLPPITSTTSQPIPCGVTRCHKSINPEHVFGCYSPDDWIGAMWTLCGRSQADQPKSVAAVNTYY